MPNQPHKFASILMVAAMIIITLGVMAANQPPTATAQLINTKNQPVGTAVLTQTPQGVKIRLDATNLTPGTLAFHIHETGQCDASTGFKTAGGHFNPTGRAHGAEASGGAHAGDMPNLKVAADGTLHTEVLNPAVTLESGPTSLLDLDGSALVIHAAADDYKSQPAGNAGDRIACGVIQPGK